MKKQRIEFANRNAKQIARVGSQLIRHYWIGIAFIAVLGLAIVAPTVEAAPMPQRTVPTATPPSPPTPTPEPSPDDNDNNDNNSSVLDLFEPTATPEPIDLGDDELLSGAGGFPNDDIETSDLFTDDLVPSDAESDELPAFDEELPFDEDGLNGLVDASFVNMFSGPDANSGIIDTLFRNTPVQVLGRDTSGEWVQVCCGEDRGNQGWVPAADLNLEFDLGAPDLELPTFGDNAITDAELLTDLELEAEIAELELTMFLESGNVRPGQIVELQYEVTNVGTVDAVDVSLRNELPAILEFETADFINGDLTETINASNNDAPVFRIDWPGLGAGESVTVTVVIQVSDDAQYGLVVDNLAGVGATNASIETAGVTMGTPPLLPPDFRFNR